MIPQLLLCGLFVPRDALPRVLELVSDVLPLSYAVDAMQRVATASAAHRRVVGGDLAVVVGVRRRRPRARCRDPAAPTA